MCIRDSNSAALVITDNFNLSILDSGQRVCYMRKSCNTGSECSSYIGIDQSHLSCLSLIHILDYRTAGMQPSDLVLIAARPSMGKTAFVLNIAQHEMCIRDRDLELPYALLDDSGKVIWTNIAFENVVHQPKGYNCLLYTSVTNCVRLMGENNRSRYRSVCP